MQQLSDIGIVAAATLSTILVLAVWESVKGWFSRRRERERRFVRRVRGGWR
jgi:hypothetical protein